MDRNESPPTQILSLDILRQFIELNSDVLLKTLKFYLLRAGIFDPSGLSGSDSFGI
jgi:hypothetical protein